ncbi:golgin IMH1 [Humulus lupulus]|uniref:golgin IMH1 n=1 Tax=Humulus lupulus TaxID=3486 RepID=UPI002B40CA52|nr:golgin IMH1 [Humulus lupulus]XP_062092788.1 golgin IMH1 [Humulus lupulus]XP_062092789.1 golgin IMH1 [Humulus lupulus]XP_062092790.1 golgin IMH1 [Humulus lupulus]XP_062092791.1 golgin IMH1 [Humulus lupulus]
MKKLFFFRSSASSGNGNSSNKEFAQPSNQEETYWENPSSSQASYMAESSFPSSRGLFSKSRKQVSDIQNSSNTPALRRSRSMSSAAFLGVEPAQLDFSSPRNQSRSPTSSVRSGVPHQHNDHSFRSLTPERQTTKRSACSSKKHHDSSGSSSTSSSNVSSKIVDRYIDGEQQEQSRSEHNAQGNFSGSGNVGCWRPPRVQYASPSSPTERVKEKARGHSFREAKSSRLHFSSRDWAEYGFGHESPRRLAKNIVERLSQSRVQETSQKEIDYDMPVTIEDVYSGSLNRDFDANSDTVPQRNYSLDEPCKTIKKYHGEDDYPYLQNKVFGDHCEGLNAKESLEEMDVRLRKRSKEAEERVMILSEELEQQSFLHRSGFDVPSLIQTIRNLAEERVSLALDVSSLLHSQIAERASFKEELRHAKKDLESQTRRLEKEKNELQSALEREIDRRSNEWSGKLEKYQLEEQRLRERVRELAEQNVSLQREVSSFNERDAESRSKITYFEQQYKDLTIRVENMKEENQDLQKNLTEFQENYRAAEDNRVCVQKNFESKERECRELHKSITRLLRTCSEQEKTIDGLREAFDEKLGKSEPLENFDKHVVRLQMEQMRLTGVEVALRRELESLRLEVDSLRHENMNLLTRSKGNGREGDALTIRLDKEMWTRICCLQNQGLSVLNENSQLCSKLLDFVKVKISQCSETKQGNKVIKHGLDGHFVIEAEMKVQGMRREIENLSRSLQKISGLLDDRSKLAASIFQLKNTDANGSMHSNRQTPEDLIKYELKAEILLTNLLREKLYSKEQEVEQLQAELATAVRGTDILQCEVQNAMDNVSFVTHKLKDLELQMLKKDNTLNRLQTDLQESTKELTVMRGILPKISAERDLMWNEVKQYSEKNMLLNSEVNVLKKKLESLDEEILLKEGQITILKDTIGKKPFDLLSSPDSTREFCLQ